MYGVNFHTFCIYVSYISGVRYGSWVVNFLLVFFSLHIWGFDVCVWMKQLVEWGFEAGGAGRKGVVFFSTFLLYKFVCVVFFFFVRYEEFFHFNGDEVYNIYEFCIYLCEVSHFLHIYIYNTFVHMCSFFFLFFISYICVIYVKAWASMSTYDNDY